VDAATGNDKNEGGLGAIPCQTDKKGNNKLVAYASIFFNVGTFKEGIFLTTFYGLYFSHHFLHMLQITILYCMI
jgi:hypothetical protein